jgi:uncharacterized protein (TIGR02996 family)
MPSKRAASTKRKRTTRTVPAPALARGASDASEQEALLAAIYAAPGDDAPRAVYADWLLERDDPHGELISLQLARAAGKATEKTQRREAELACDHSRTWLGPLDGAVRYAVYARGFATHVQLHRWPTQDLVDMPMWSTVETIGLEDTESDGVIAAILRGPGQSVKGLLDASPALLGKIDLQRIERLEGIFVDDGVPKPVLAWLKSARRARRLRLTVDEQERMSVDFIEKLLAAPGRLEHLVLERCDELHALIDAVAESSIRTLTVHEWFGGGALRFERGEDGGTFTRVRVWREATGHIERNKLDGRSLSVSIPSVYEGDVIVDAREPHVPGIEDWWRPSRHTPTEQDLAELGNARVETGLWCPLDELPLLGWS